MKLTRTFATPGCFSALEMSEKINEKLEKLVDMFKSDEIINVESIETMIIPLDRPCAQMKCWGIVRYSFECPSNMYPVYIKKIKEEFEDEQ